MFPPLVAMGLLKRSASALDSVVFSLDDREPKRPKTEADATEPTPKKRFCMDTLRDSCDSYERDLLSCIVEPDKLNTGYDDVHVHPSAKASLQSLTLALHCPEEFTYGVLAGSNITGVLLYGPPGTGKTMLVKAFAQESGATVLEISGADVLSKYVGEGEKTIRAIFSLARKLHPCVIFIDEVDGIFGKRETCDKRHQRTEMNQFLREWDGLSSNNVGSEGAVLVVATNRPFDLDDAILRRLPHRILIDMPEVDDRAAILGIHLKGERLDPDINLHEVASMTPFYTGSDLKNMVVAAALRCVRERMAAKAKGEGRAAAGNRSTAPEDAAAAAAAAADKSPVTDTDTNLLDEEPGARRMITMEHLLRAKNDIRPATSKEGLVAIRDFHSKFGNTAKLD